MPNPAAKEKAEASLDLKVGLAVKDARSASGMTLMTLATKSGVSAAMISKIERGQVSASLSTLNALAEALGLPIINLFAETVHRSEYSLVKAGQGVAVHRVGNTFNHTYRMIGRINPAQFDFEPYIITLERPMGGEPVYHHAGLEFIHILEGSLKYRCGETVLLLEPGDSLTFETLSPHGPVQLLSDKVIMLTVIVRPKSSAR